MKKFSLLAFISIFIVSIIAQESQFGLQIWRGNVVTYQTLIDNIDSITIVEGEHSDGRFVIEIPAVDYNNATIKITAQDTTITYFAGAYPATTIAAYGSDAAVLDSITALIEAKINYQNEYYKALYEAFGKEWTEEDAYTFANFITHGSQTKTETGLAASTDYVEVLFELDAQGKHGNSLYKESFTTTEFKPVSELKVAIKYEAPILTFTPSNNNDQYFWNIVSDEELEEYGFDTIEEMADDDIVYYGEDIEQYLSKGVDQADLSEYEAEENIAAGDVINAYAFGYANGSRTTEVFTIKFTYASAASAPARLLPVRHLPARQLAAPVAPKAETKRLRK